MSFEAGKSGNPAGRPKGSYGGRIQALAALDRMMGKKKNQALLEKELEKDFQNDPVRFFKSVIMPLLPRESKLKFEQDNIVEWRSLLDINPIGGEVRTGYAQGEGVSLLPAPSDERAPPEPDRKGA